MTYSLRRGDKDLGTATLDELQRRRESGELTGGEYVKGSSESHWRLLEDVLSLEKLGAGPPLLGTQALSPGRSRAPIVLALGFAVVLLGAAAFFLKGRGGQVAAYQPQSQNQPQNPSEPQSLPSSQTPLQLASRPIVPAKTETEKDVKARLRLFKRRQWLDGYDLRGVHEGGPDPAAEKFIEAVIGDDKEGPKDPKLSLEAESERLAHDPTCKDPAVLALAASSTLNWYDRVNLYKRAVAAFPSSRHLAYPALYAELRLMNESKYDSGEEGELDTTALAHLARCFTDGSFQPGDQQEIAEIFVDGWGTTFFGKNDAAICKVAYEAGPSYHWLALVLDGYRDITDAWAARGDGYSNTVSDQQHAEFIRLLTEAHKPLEEAWSLQPGYPMAPNLMIYDSLGSGLADMRMWFDRTVAAQIDYPGAWSNLRWGLQPRWYGNGPAEIALGKVALATGRFDTDVPRKLFDCVTDVEGWSDLPQGQRIFGREDIWPALQKMYEGYVAEPSQAHSIHGWRTSYAVVAYFAGHFDVARRQLEANDWKISPSALNSWGVDLSSMPLEVAARTGPLAAEVGAAEVARSSGDRATALRKFAELDARHTPDARTTEFIKLRLSRLTDEQHLAEGKWVALMPAADHDANWVYSFGKPHRNEDGSLDVEYGRGGHMMFAKEPVGGNFEVRGSYEVVRSSDTNFQGGIVIGQPDIKTYKWFAFRLKRHDVEGDIATFGLGWTLREMTQPVTLNEKSNSFDLVLRNGKVTASVNGERVFDNADTPATLDTPEEGYLVGLGAFSDSAEAVVRYRGVEIRTLGPTDDGSLSSPAEAMAAPASAPKAETSRQDLPEAEQIAADRDEMARAIEGVKAIVNQPALSVPITDDMNVTRWSDTWFHPGAIVPDYAKVDVTKSQQLSYSQYEYVTSKLHPEVAFLGSDLEFNPMTKYFYTDLTVPKKRLTQSEMLEVNRLYRVIARCKADLARLQAK